MSDGIYANIRDLEALGPLLGQRIVEITQHDKDEWQETGRAYVMLHFENGMSLKFWIGDDGFEILDVLEADGEGDRWGV